MNFHHIGTAIVTGILATTLCIWSISTHALTVSGLYEAEIPVTDQSVGSRKTAIRAALRIVLVKLTGDRNAPERAALDPVLAQAERYALQFRYRDELSRPEQKAMKLWVQFDENALNEIMRDYGIPLWGKERPSTLVWLASNGSAGRQLVNIEDSSDYLGMLEKRAQLRGISLLFPLFDLEDSSHLKASDIWGGFSEPVTSASERYHADTILTGSLEQVIPSVWEARWTVYIDGQATTNWVTQGDLPDVVLDEGIDGVVDIVREHDRTTMYDIKTHDPEFIEANKEFYQQQLNVYAHIWQNLRKQQLDETAVISTHVPSQTRKILDSGTPAKQAVALEEWNPVIPKPFDSENVDETIADFGKVIDDIEYGEFSPPPTSKLKKRALMGLKLTHILTG